MNKLLRKFQKPRKPTHTEIEDYVLNLCIKGKDSQKRKIYDILMSDLFHSVTLSDLEKSFQSLPKATQEIMLSEAEMIQKSVLHTWISEELVRLIQKRIYVDSKSEFEIAINKMGLWVEKNRKTLVDNLVQLSKKKEFIKSMKKY